MHVKLNSRGTTVHKASCLWGAYRWPAAVGLTEQEVIQKVASEPDMELCWKCWTQGPKPRSVRAKKAKPPPRKVQARTARSESEQIAMAFGLKIKVERESQKMSIADLANIIGVTEYAVGRVEDGRGNLSISRMCLFANGVGLRLTLETIKRMED